MSECIYFLEEMKLKFINYAQILCFKYFRHLLCFGIGPHFLWKIVS